MYISDPGNDGRARTMIPNGCTAVGARGCSADVRVVAPTNAVIAWTNAPRPWSLCHSRVHLTVLTTPRHFTANTIMVFYSNSLCTSLYISFLNKCIRYICSANRWIFSSLRDNRRNEPEGNTICDRFLGESWRRRWQYGCRFARRRRYVKQQ